MAKSDKTPEETTKHASRLAWGSSVSAGSRSRHPTDQSSTVYTQSTASLGAAEGAGALILLLRVPWDDVIDPDGDCVCMGGAAVDTPGPGAQHLL